MSKLLEGKVAIVTGGGGGIGREAVRVLLEDGARVVVADIAEAAGQDTLADVDGGDAVTFVQTDVTDIASTQNLVAQAVERFGRLDICFNNAGVEYGGTNIVDVPVDAFERVIRVNLTGIFVSMKAQIPQLLRQGGGSIINTSSALGVQAQPGQSAYVASKHGVIGLTKAAAAEYSAQGIRVNALMPGVVSTPMLQEMERATPGFTDGLLPKHLNGRLGTTREIADAVVWLGSDRSTFVTGATIEVDGGFTAH